MTNNQPDPLWRPAVARYFGLTPFDPPHLIRLAREWLDAHGL